MCGRYTNRLSWTDIVRLYRVASYPGPALNLRPRFNVAPTQDVVAVRTREGTGDRELAMLRWGLIPAWTKPDAPQRSPLINARSETVAEKPSFRQAFRRRRCLIVADGFFEWGKGKSGKQPYWITLADRAPFAFAGLWERWEKSPDGKTVDSCAIVTTEANELVARIHDRMPVILAPEDYESWLDIDGTPADRAQSLLRPYPAAAMTAVPVSARVNSVKNDDEGCVEPVG